MTRPTMQVNPAGLVSEAAARKSLAEMKAKAQAQSSLGKDKRFGLSMWFEVIVQSGHGLTTPLGEWSGCSGLGIVLKPEEHKQGGSYDGVVRLPGEVSYGQITLERAMERKSSKMVQDWLRDVVKEWINADDAGATYQGNLVTIKLFSSYNDGEIFSWSLNNVVPVSWTGPSLSARSGDVAMEKLTIAHDGFLPKTEQTQGKLKLALLGGVDSDVEKESITFDYLPTQVTTNRTITFQRGSVMSDKPEDQVLDPGKLNVKLGVLLIDGATAVKKTVPKLYSWLEDVPATGGGGAGTTDQAAGKVHHFKVSMGTSGEISYRVVLKGVTADYSRFTSTGDPSRAKVSLILEEVAKVTAKTNPTSGSPEDGKLHRVTAGDSLQSIATQTYGRSSDWRRVADENQIDDPLRLRNGSSLLLPGAS